MVYLNLNTLDIEIHIYRKYKLGDKALDQNKYFS